MNRSLEGDEDGEYETGARETKKKRERERERSDGRNAPDVRLIQMSR